MTTSAIDDQVAPSDEPTTPVKRKAVLEMAFEAQVALVEALRERRFALKTFIQKARNKNSTVKLESLHNKTEIAINQLSTKVLRIDGYIEKAEESINKIRVLLLEMGVAITRDGDDM